ncbi:hypothetical protein [Haloquadratum walsbyi]|uniref:Uncharacterized protein n=1 Tax=Haloquadratum walsbyi J07HQW2 TaxID=1238425 RepID=U1PPR1_9EURY|nr:hypothetical protein [Haloquadratum walsbyi]ERG94301.1 MAG: hypothetical protein J07HQW2_00735 [Haloquadratum walsbyi J07HQW2]
MSLESFLESIMLLGGSVLAVDGILPGLFAGIAATGVGLSLTISGIKELNRSWRIFTTDSVPIDEAVGSDELVQITGVHPSQPSETILSPIHNQVCVAYKYEIRSQLNDGCSIDSGTEYRPFNISDETAGVLITPTTETLSLNTQKQTVTGGREVSSEIDEEKINVDPLAEISDSGSVPNPIELIEGALSLGEQMTVVGKANPTPKTGAKDTSIDVDTDADAVMTPETDHLNVMNDLTGTTVLKRDTVGALFAIVGSQFTLIGLAIFISTLSSLT